MVMAWNRDLEPALVLKDGRRVGTIRSAFDVFLSLPRAQQESEHWRSAVEALAGAGLIGESGSAEEIRMATDVLTVAFKVDGMI
jgi:hypothetical protein